MPKNYQLDKLNKEISSLESLIKIEIIKNEKIKLRIQKKKLEIEKLKKKEWR